MQKAANSRKLKEVENRIRFRKVLCIKNSYRNCQIANSRSHNNVAFKRTRRSVRETHDFKDGNKHVTKKYAIPEASRFEIAKNYKRESFEDKSRIILI